MRLQGDHWLSSYATQAPLWWYSEVTGNTFPAGAKAHFSVRCATWMRAAFVLLEIWSLLQTFSEYNHSRLLDSPNSLPAKPAPRLISIKWSKEWFSRGVRTTPGVSKILIQGLHKENTRIYIIITLTVHLCNVLNSYVFIIYKITGKKSWECI